MQNFKIVFYGKPNWEVQLQKERIPTKALLNIHLSYNHTQIIKQAVANNLRLTSFANMSIIKSTKKFTYTDYICIHETTLHEIHHAQKLLLHDLA